MSFRPHEADLVQPPNESIATTVEVTDRRSFLRTLGGLCVVVTAGAALEVTGARPAHAGSGAQPPPVIPGDQPSPEERAKTAAETENLKAQTENSKVDTRLKEEQAEREEAERAKIQRELNPTWYEKAAKVAGSLTAPGAVLGGLLATARYFSERAKEREIKRITLEQEQRALEEREDDSYQKLIEQMGGAQKSLDTLRSQKPLSQEDILQLDYRSLMLAYHQLKRFTSNPRFADRIFSLTVGLLRDRAPKQIRPEGISDEEHKRLDTLREKELPTDRELLEHLVAVLPRLPRSNDQGAELPNLSGISLTGMRYLRLPLQGVNLEGAHIPGVLVTGSLAGSRCKLTHFEGSTFGEVGNPCNMCGTDLSEAILTGAHFAYVKIDKDTKFGAGLRGDPRVTFGRVTSDTLSQEEVDQKIAEAKAAIDQYQPGVGASAPADANH